MNRISNIDKRLSGVSHKHPQLGRDWLFDSENLFRTYDEVTDEQRLKRFLKRAVASVDAPQSLIDSIQRNIRD